MYKPVEVVEVRVWGRRVGAVALDPNLGYYAFEYDPAFVKEGIELAPLTMPLARAAEPFVFTDLPEQTYKRLPALLADALPDDFGNALIDAWMAKQGVDRERITALLTSEMGHPSVDVAYAVAKTRAVKCVRVSVSE